MHEVVLLHFVQLDKQAVHVFESSKKNDSLQSEQVLSLLHCLQLGTSTSQVKHSKLSAVRINPLAHDKQFLSPSQVVQLAPAAVYEH